MTSDVGPLLVQCWLEDGWPILCQYWPTGQNPAGPTLACQCKADIGPPMIFDVGPLLDNTGVMMVSQYWPAGHNFGGPTLTNQC